MSEDAENSARPDEQPEDTSHSRDDAARDSRRGDDFDRDSPESIDQPTAKEDSHDDSPFEDDFVLSIDQSNATTRTDLRGGGDDGFSIRSGAVEAEAVGGDDVQIGRYQVQELLGQGGFGAVYLAHDPRLSRHVAIKIPRGDRVVDELAWKGFLSEGRAVAAMRHESIVTIHDIDRTENGIPFVVMEFVPGKTLSKFVRHEKPDFSQRLQISRQIADALRYAHRQSVIHRDLKPSNIIIDDDHGAKIMDFGLALRVNQPMNRISSGIAGTLSFMSPEQVRAENHRMDGRSDIWSLGVIMYWLFTGQRPFHGETMDEVVEEITSREPKPMRQLDDTIPPELDRICRKCLQKLMPDRYASAADLVEDLDYLIERVSLYGLSISKNRSTPGLPPAQPSQSHFTAETARTGRQVDSTQYSQRTGDSTVSRSVGSLSSGPGSMEETSPVRIVPKGLRSFDVNDAEFFRELLPGPVDRFGIPESLRFWTARLSDSGSPLVAGLIYGPSGCGKSSFVKAGLFPQLPEDHRQVYVECSAERTETTLKSRLVHALNERDIEHVDTVDLIIGLRTGRFSTGGTRLLIVLDQFEQWLSGDRNHPESELVNALRQCDGYTVQVLFLVRDDFWMQFQNLFKLLGYKIQDGRNALALPLFDKRHATKVLKAFGRAYNALPADKELARQQKEFVSDAIESISRNDKVICAHLSLFAELMQGREWTRTGLTRIGGWKGIGIRFLDRTFSEESATAAVRPYCESARGVLSALLPSEGGPIKGASRSRAELQQQLRDNDLPATDNIVDATLNLLDKDMRLITRVDADAATSGKSSPGFQLAHDVLVEPVRQWMALKQNETWQGRAALRMKELAARWTARQESRNLPTFTEFVQISTGVPGRRMSREEKSMMSRARSYFALRIVAVAAVMGLLLAGYRYFDNQNQRELISGRIDSLESTPVGGIPATIELVASDNQPLAHKILEQRLDDAEGVDARLRLNLAMARMSDPENIPVDRIVAAIGNVADGYSLPVINSLLQTQGDSKREAIEQLQERLEQSNDPRIRSRYASTLFYLGELDSLEQFLAFGPLPDDRTAFVHCLESWSGDFEPVLTLIEAASANPGEFKPSTLYSLLLARAVADPGVSDEQSERLEAALDKLVQNKNASAPVVSAGLALIRKLEFAEPELPRMSTDEVMRIRAGDELMTFYRIGSGSVALNRDSILPAQLFTPAATGEDLPPTPDRILTNDEAFFLTETPVTASAFRAFINDPDTVERLKEAGVEDLAMLYNAAYFNRRLNGQDDVADGITWFAALEFCNWLSLQTNREPFYKLKYQKPDLGNEVVCISLETGGNGFRLPTYDQCEFAARGGTRTAYFYGHASREDLLDFYGEYALPSSSTFKVGRKLPNPFGLFDMNGFADQWCHDPMGAMGMADYFGSDRYGSGHSASRGKRFVNATSTIKVCFRVALPAD
ncbi:MAG: protein kinase [Planctomycetota bacterium]